MNQMLKKVQMDIQKNFGKDVNWDSLPKGSFNCYMFAVFNTVPTEVLDFVDEEHGIAICKCLTNEKLSIGGIGGISGRIHYTTVAGLIKALKCDLACLGILLEDSSLEEIVTNPFVKIAFYYDKEGLSKCKNPNFHFVRQDGDQWLHKTGWAGKVEKIDIPIENFSCDNLYLIGYFKLSLMQKNHNS